MVTRLDWWIGVVLVVLAILAHALVPRYEYQQAGPSGIGWIRPAAPSGAAGLPQRPYPPPAGRRASRASPTHGARSSAPCGLLAARTGAGDYWKASNDLC